MVEPVPPEGGELDSLKLWRPDHPVPALVIEVVSPNHPTKDYSLVPEKCAAAGVGELVVFDPKLAGPRIGGGPHLLQVWRRVEGKGFSRIHAGNAPAFSPLLGAFWFPLEGGPRLGIAGDVDGREMWLTLEQAERIGKQAALRRVAEPRSRDRPGPRIALIADRASGVLILVLDFSSQLERRAAEGRECRARSRPSFSRAPRCPRASAICRGRRAGSTCTASFRAAPAWR